MKNKFLATILIIVFLLQTSCQKDITGNDITIQANTNATVNYFYVYNTCQPGPGQPLGIASPLENNGGGNYSLRIESGYESSCFTITGDVPANSDTTGKTIIDIDVFYTEEGNTIGFQNIELDRPHGEHNIFYEFRPDTYIE